MINLVEFIEELSTQGVELWADGDRLRYRSPQHVLTQALSTSIKQNKAEILQLLRDRAEAPGTYPLSHGQQALWFVHQNAKDSAAYNIAVP
ncbi:NcpA, partial [Candidatus Thiomargarita nelsonii]